MKTKSIKSIAFVVFITTLVSGCVKNYDLPPKTQKGKAIHDTWHKGADAVFQRYLDIAFAFNTWYNAPLSQKDSIEDTYFPQYKIRHIESDQWGLYFNSHLAYRIDRQYKSLSDANAFWVIDAINPTLDLERGYDYDNYYYYGYELASFLFDETTTIYINSIGTNEWRIQIDPRIQDSNLDINLKSIDGSAFASLYENPFVWSGRGIFFYVHDSYAYISFETVEDIVCHPQGRKEDKQDDDNNYYYRGSSEQYPYENSLFHWSAGKVSLNAINAEETDTIKVDASFSKLSNTRYQVHITYKGKNGEWIENWKQ